MKRLFIINPKSGKGSANKALQRAIEKYFPGAPVIFTERKGHAQSIAAQAVADGVQQLIVAGGDGTINEVVQSLAFSDTALGIIAKGSGNGLARELGCPLNNFDAACQNILNASAVSCDLGRAGADYFINLAGVGIEADIADKFDKHGKRGMLPYFKIGARAVLNYKPPVTEVILDNKETKTLSPLTLVFANGRQYGSNFRIAPKASLRDGLLDMVIVEDANKFRLFLSLPNFFADGASPVKATKTHKIKKAEVKIKGSFCYHIDGEPKTAQDSLAIEIIPSAIKLLMIDSKRY